MSTRKEAISKHTKTHTVKIQIQTQNWKKFHLQTTIHRSEKINDKNFPNRFGVSVGNILLPDFDVHNKTSHKPFLKAFKLEYYPAKNIFWWKFFIIFSLGPQLNLFSAKSLSLKQPAKKSLSCKICQMVYSCFCSDRPHIFP